VWVDIVFGLGERLIQKLKWPIELATVIDDQWLTEYRLSVELVAGRPLTTGNSTQLKIVAKWSLVFCRAMRLIRHHCHNHHHLCLTAQCQNMCCELMCAMSKPPITTRINFIGGVKFLTGRKNQGHPWSTLPSSSMAACSREHYYSAGQVSQWPTSMHWQQTKRIT